MICLLFNRDRKLFFFRRPRSPQSLDSKNLSLFVQIVLNVVGAIPNFCCLLLELYSAFIVSFIYNFVSKDTAFLLPEDTM